MQTVNDRLNALFASAFKKKGLDTAFARVVESQRPELCDYQCNGALNLTKVLKRNPREIAAEILEAISDDEDLIESTSIEGPGFINIKLSEGFILAQANSLVSDERAGCPEAEAKKNIIIDFCGPNVAKPMHVGHIRSTIIGDSLVRLNRFIGHKVGADIHLGDWGTQMGMLIREVERIDSSLPYFSEEELDCYPAEPPISLKDLETMYPAASSRCKSDPAEMEKALSATLELHKGNKGFRALWQHFVNLSVGDLKKDLKFLGVKFDYWKGESSYQNLIQPMVEQLKEKGLTELSDGALIIRLRSDKIKEDMPPVILLKSDGAALYHTTDLAAIQERVFDMKADTLLYVVDKRQALHFKQVFTASEMAGWFDGIAAEHIGFGTVNGPDGKPFKTREGGVMKLKDLITMVRTKALERMDEIKVAKDLDDNERASIADMVGLATLKYSDLVNNRLSDYIFDIDKFSRFEGKTGPYILYSAVRIKSILRKAADVGVQAGEITSLSEKSERELLLDIFKLPGVLNKAAETHSPNLLCEYVFNLSQLFNRFYQSCHILNEEDKAKQASWLSLSELSLKVMQIVCSLIGIEVPERM